MAPPRRHRTKASRVAQGSARYGGRLAGARHGALGVPPAFGPSLVSHKRQSTTRAHRSSMQRGRVTLGLLELLARRRVELTVLYRSHQRVV